MGRMKRRSLVSLIPAASILAALRSNGPPVDVSPLTEAGFGIAIQLWSFRKHTLLDAIELAAAAGAGGVEFYPGQRVGGDFGDEKFGVEMRPEAIGAVMEKLRGFGLKAWNIGILPISPDLRKAIKVFEFAKRMELYGITTESLASLDTIEPLARKFGIKICFHNHPRPTKLWNPETILKNLESRHKNLGFCIDVGHLASSGIDCFDMVKAVAPRIHSFHMKDRGKPHEWSHDRPFGTGIIEISKILAETRHHGFHGNVSIEYEHNWDSNLAEIAQCVGFLRSTGLT